MDRMKWIVLSAPLLSSVVEWSSSALPTSVSRLSCYVMECLTVTLMKMNPAAVSYFTNSVCHGRNADWEW